MSALERLQAERKSLLKDKPLVRRAATLAMSPTLLLLVHFKGFFAKPKKNVDGTKNYFEWDCGVPGKQGVRWLYRWLPLHADSCVVALARRPVQGHHDLQRKLSYYAAELYVTRARYTSTL